MYLDFSYLKSTKIVLPLSTSPEFHTQKLGPGETILYVFYQMKVVSSKATPPPFFWGGGIAFSWAFYGGLGTPSETSIPLEGCSLVRS